MCFVRAVRLCLPGEAALVANGGLASGEEGEQAEGEEEDGDDDGPDGESGAVVGGGAAWAGDDHGASAGDFGAFRSLGQEAAIQLTYPPWTRKTKA